MNTKAAHWAYLLASSGLLPGCGDPLVERQVITGLRLLGARYEAEDEPERASPRVGEHGSVHFLVAGPEGPLEVQFHLFACAAREQVRGVPTCAEVPVAELRGRSDHPRLDFTVPEATRLLTAGTFCTQGDVSSTSDISTGMCLDASADQELSTYEVEIPEDLASSHRHPNLSDAELRVNGSLWNEEDTPCVPAGQDANVELFLPPDARDLRPPEEPAGPWETLQVSHVSTTGRFDRAFTVFAGDASELQTSIAWRAPEAAGVAHIYFVVRDMRGGVSWLIRSLCTE